MSIPVIDAIVSGKKIEDGPKWAWMKFRRRLKFCLSFLTQEDREFIRWFSPDIGDSIIPIHKLIWKAYKSREAAGWQNLERLKTARFDGC